MEVAHLAVAEAGFEAGQFAGHPWALGTGFGWMCYPELLLQCFVLVFVAEYLRW